MTMCNIHIHILSTHSVLLDIQLSIHIIHRIYTFYIMYTYIYTHTIIRKVAVDYT